MTLGELPLADLTLVGTTSAGKSMLANALGGRWIMAFSVQPTTRGVIDLLLTHRPLPPASHWGARLLGREELIVDTGGAFKRYAVSAACRSVLSRIAVQGFRAVSRRPRFILRDTPGISGETDQRHLSVVCGSVKRSRVVAVLLSAEDTNLMKKRALVTAVVDGTRNSYTRILWLISRADAFLRDRSPSIALSRHRRDMARLIATAGGTIDAEGRGFVAVSPRPAFLAIVLSDTRRLGNGISANLRRWACDDFAAHGICDRLGAIDPIHGATISRLRALRALWIASGAGELDRHLDALLPP